MATIPPPIERRILELLRFIYGEERDERLLQAIQQLIDQHPIPARTTVLDQRTALLITYGDHVQKNGSAPLAVLDEFATKYLSELVSGIHILPFCPFTSDDGFSVVDYLAINPELGDWDDVERLGNDFSLMFDFVLNHISASSEWFKGFLRDEVPERDYFVTLPANTDVSMVVRPRTHPLLTPFETKAGIRHVWTTFSEDQIDLNFASPSLLIEMLRVLLIYAERGADFVRLDAIAYLWKVPGTTSIHLPETHAVVQLMRAVLDAAAPWVKIITETNVPHKDNISYFGSGDNEAQLVYNFALPPLTVHSLHTGSAGALSAWASTLAAPSPETTFFNFTASHDGIGVQPAKGLLSESEIDAMIARVLEHGGQVSYKANADGSRSPYEMNCTYFDALSAVDEEYAVERFVLSQAIMLSLAGVPGVYLPSLFGARNWTAGVAQTGRARTINRQKFDISSLENDLDDAALPSAQVFQRYSKLLRIRRSQPAFHPKSPQKVLDMHPAVFAIERGTGDERILALHNVSGETLELDLPDGKWRALQTETEHNGRLTLLPYQLAWLRCI